ncbi:MULTISPECIES: GNAT family N-acetyltransferase [unclassified Paenibacillus]|uniref:GNAT family N-acetyltransferase n=1 Tax=unclassified Paenibacillus TaxID=185978 RepID=UPI0009A752D7|nr:MULTISPECIES: GNAT family N-acetyltransferase [unclassified Paenibacillus]SLK13552.1 Ribosomal protein S18 acetylase RimI [Paenibacillus sp. RU5A]SOC73064.1 Ribosomal protein S18 acetylase RimI [Paenibacillus sp. RU26A]SOC75356.1 Ribosomal protein S18 acetylase RimI [Paenibacillus sp. RU5M]
MDITFRESLEGIGIAQLSGAFFEGWPNPPSTPTFLKLLEQSYAVELAIDEETGNVVGFIQAISDGVLSAYIPLLEVLPEYQGKGIGTDLIKRMFNRLGDLYMIDLLCDNELQEFYEKQGMQKTSGMVIRHYQNQAGAVSS